MAASSDPKSSVLSNLQPSQIVLGGGKALVGDGDGLLLLPSLYAGESLQDFESA